MNIDPVSSIQAARPLTSVQPLGGAGKNANGFIDLTSNVARDVNESQVKANDRVAQLAAGKTDNVHQVMLSLGKAELSFNYMLEIRSRLLEAYKEVMRMPL